MVTSPEANPLIEATPPPALESAGASPAVAPTQPAAVIGSKLDAIRAKKAAGETLTPAERGFLGGVSRKSAKSLPALAAAHGGATLVSPAPASHDNPLFAGESPAGLPVQAVVAPQLDSALVRATANALLSSADTLTQIYVGYESKQAGDNKQTIDDFKAAAALQPGNRALMVENSEPVILTLCEWFKCSPEELKGKLQGSAFFAGAAAHVAGVIAAVKTIRQRGNPAPAPVGGGK
jgi:hypothetical protein